METKQSIVDVLIENITQDQALLTEAEERIEEARSQKKEISDRLKGYQKDITVVMKYADDNQRKKIEDLGFDLSESKGGLNAVATTAFDIIVKAKGNKLSNGAWYEQYVDSLKNKETAVSYTEFNIKCRSLFNSQRLLRTKGKDPQNTSREDLISLNGRVQKETSNK